MIADAVLMNAGLIMICQDMPNCANKCIDIANLSKFGIVHYLSSCILTQGPIME